MSWIYDELYPVRNFHAAFPKGRLVGAHKYRPAISDRRLAWGFMPHEHHVPGYERMEKLDESDRER